MYNINKYNKNMYVSQNFHVTVIFTIIFFCTQIIQSKSIFKVIKFLPSKVVAILRYPTLQSFQKIQVENVQFFE